VLTTGRRRNLCLARMAAPVQGWSRRFAIGPRSAQVNFAQEKKAPRSRSLRSVRRRPISSDARHSALLFALAGFLRVLAALVTGAALLPALMALAALPECLRVEGDADRSSCSSGSPWWFLPLGEQTSAIRRRSLGCNEALLPDETPKPPSALILSGSQQRCSDMGRYLLLSLLGIPIPILLLIWPFGGLH